MKFRMTSGYGELSLVRDFRPHTGIDFAMPEGTTLRSISNGVVEQVFSGKGSLGNGLQIRMPDGKHAIYGHLSKVKAHVGERIHAGEVIGFSGNTGNSTGPHLHYAMKSADGHYVDPTPLADKVASLSGDHVSPGIITALFNNKSTQGPVTRLFYNSTESVRDQVADVATEVIYGIFDALKDLLFGVALVGSAICIILKVAGWKDGGRWAGMLITTRILLKFLFGGA